MKYKQYVSIGFVLLAVCLGLVGSTPADPRVPDAQAQGACPTSVSFGSWNGTVSIDSAVAAITSGCPAGTNTTYYVQIPSSSAHPCSTTAPPYCWHDFITTTAAVAWIDLFRNESNPTEYPDGYYSFWACASQCVQSAQWYLSTPAGAAGGHANPWAPPWSNMQWVAGLCLTSTACDSGSQNMQGLLLNFIATSDNTNAGGSILYQNLNGYFTAPNPGDPEGLTQLVASRYATGYSALFYEFSNNVVYCTAAPTVTINNPTNSCSLERTNDNQPHSFWMQINTTPAACKDTRYPCLQAYLDGVFFTEERMINGGTLRSPNAQNEAYTSTDSSVWGAQLNYWDYSNAYRPGAMNQGLSVHYTYNYVMYLNGQGQWNQMFWNTAANNRRRYISNPPGSDTFNVYCGAFAWAFTTNSYQSSSEFGTRPLQC